MQDKYRTILIILYAWVALLVVVMFGYYFAHAQTVHTTIPGTDIPDFKGESWTWDKSQNTWQSAIPGTDIPDFKEPGLKEVPLGGEDHELDDFGRGPGDSEVLVPKW